MLGSGRDARPTVVRVSSPDTPAVLRLISASLARSPMARRATRTPAVQAHLPLLRIPQSLRLDAGRRLASTRLFELAGVSGDFVSQSDTFSHKLIPARMILLGKIAKQVAKICYHSRDSAFR